LPRLCFWLFSSINRLGIYDATGGHLVHRPDGTFSLTTPNLVERRFAVPEPDRSWAADAIYLMTGEELLYLAFVLDSRSHPVVGWLMADHLRARLAVEPWAWRSRGAGASPGRPPSQRG